LNEQFNELALDSRSRVRSDESGMVKLEEPQPFPGLAIPKPLRLGKLIDEQPKLNTTP